MKKAAEGMDPIQWQQANEEYLAQALGWLRLRLARLVQHPKPVAAKDAEISKAARDMKAKGEEEPPPALVYLARRFGLSDFERSILLLCAAMELDTRIPGLCAQAQDNPNQPYPTFALALALFNEPSWDALSPNAPLRYWHLVNPASIPDLPLINRPLQTDASIVNYIKGLRHLDESLLPYLMPLEDRAFNGPSPGGSTIPNLPPSQEEIVSQIQRYLMAGLERSPVIQLVGSDRTGKWLAARQAAAQLGLHLYLMPASLLPTAPDELLRFVRLWQRETVLLPLALYVDAHEDHEPTEKAAGLSHFMARNPGILFLSVREAHPAAGAFSVAIEVAKPTPQEQYAAWEALLGENGRTSQLAVQFDMNLPAIQSAAHLAQTTGEDPWQVCLAQTRPQLDTLAARIQPKAAWEDIVLPVESLDLLHQVAAQVRRRQRVYDEWGFRERMSRGLGITALFAGESGTGKTMAAEVLANELALNLYRIDLSAVVSKYIGETEKNLRRLFDAAEDGGAILFFDEADALFGKRSEVKDSHDRYANIEINYLLQRMEAYRGLAILATNMKSALDAAFMRRLRFVIDFPFPTRQERIEIWRRVFPARMPLEGLDYEHLSRLALTGSSIHNIALNAAFLAAEADQPVNMQLLMQAARTEIHKIGRAASEAELTWTPRNGMLE